MTEVNLPPTLPGIVDDLRRRVAAIEQRLARLPALPTFTLATRPAASADNAGVAIFVSDAVDGQRFQGSDGATWKTLG